MTRNQIEYNKHLEQGRHNLATEQETNRSNVANETETKRSNLAREQETGRHNVATEKQARKELKETKRSHKANEKFNYASLSEQARHNMATENQAATNAEITKYLGQLSSATAVTTAQISAEAQKYAAALANEASHYASDTSASNTAATNLSKEAIALADRVQRGKIADAQHRVDLLRTKLDAAKAQGQITQQFYDTMTGNLQRLLSSIIGASAKSKK